LAQPSKIPSGNGVPRQPTRLTRRRLLLAALALFLLGGVAAALDLRFVTGGTPRAVEPNSLLELDPGTLRTLRNIAGRTAPADGPARGAGLVWAIDRDQNRALGMRSGRVVRTVVVGSDPVDVATGFGSVWVANSGNRSLTRVALAGSRVETLGLDDQPLGVATGAGYVWVVSPRSRRLLRIDPETNLVTKSVRLSRPPLDVVVRSGRVLATIGD
jgi:hypothetical protein